MPEALYRKWRSRTFSDLVGQPHVVRTLQNALEGDRVAHAYLFNGPRGTGKTSTARLLAKGLNCRAPEGRRPCGECEACLAIEEGRYLDLIEIDAASNNGVDDIRELRNAVNFSPTEGDSKIYIVDEVHMLSASAFNALLKTLEEPPGHVFFVLATTEIHRIPATVISRCQRFDFRLIPAREIQSHLQMIGKQEDCVVEDAALDMIAESAQGCMRDAISLLDQVVGLGQDSVGLLEVQELLGVTDSQAVNRLVEAIARKDKAAGLNILQQVLFQGAAMAEFLQQVIKQLRAAYRIELIGREEASPDLPQEQIDNLAEWSALCGHEHLLHALTVAVQAAGELRLAPHPQVLVELAIIDAIAGPSSFESAEPPVRPAPEARPTRQHARNVRQVAEKAPAARRRESSSSYQPSAQDEADKDKLRGHWTELQEVVRNRSAESGRPYQALTGKGMQDLQVEGNEVRMIMRSQEFVGALKNVSRMLQGKFSDYLGREVKLTFKVYRGTDSRQAATSPASPPANASGGDARWAQVENFVLKDMGGTRVDDDESARVPDQSE